jgi:hypothetical protein
MDLPVYNLPAVFALRKKLDEGACVPFFACPLTGDTFAAFVDGLYQAMPAGTPWEALYESVRPLAGLELTQARVEELCWRLAGNAAALKKGQVVPPWSKQAGHEWAPAQVLNVQRSWLRARQATGGAAKKKGDRPGGHVTLRLLAGTAAGLRSVRFWSTDYVHFIKKELGFSLFDRGPYRREPLKVPDLPFHDVRELARLRLFVLLDPASTRAGPDFSEVKGSPTTVAFNRALLRQRLRTSFKCPAGYTVEDVPCHHCEYGYDRCLAACHPRTFTRGECPECHRQDTWLDPAGGRPLCVDCLARPD